MNLSKAGPDRHNFIRKMSTYYFSITDRAAVIFRNNGLIVHQFFSDIHNFINDFNFKVSKIAKEFGSIIFRAILLSAPKKNKFLNLLFIVPKLIFGLPLIAATFLIQMVIILIGGSLSGILGLRNLGDYTILETVYAWIATISFCFILPYVFGPYLLFKACLIFTFTILLIGLNFLYGQCGIISLGHASFVLLGAYGTTLLYNGAFGAEFPFLLSVFIASFIVSILGIFLGALSLRIKDEYLIMITLAFAIAVPQILRSKYLESFGGGSSEGIEIKDILPPAFLSWLPKTFWHFYIIAPMFLLAVGFAYNLQVKSQIGRAFALIKCDDEIARSQGVSVTKYKLLAFVLSAFFAAFAGGLTTTISPFVSSHSFTSLDSIEYFIGLIIGGSGNIFGSLIGGVFLAFDSDIIKAVSNMVNGGQNLMRAVFGLVLVLMVNFLPEGIGGFIQKRIRAKVTPVIRRGLYFMRPPPDYDYLESKDFQEIDNGKYD